MNLISYKPENGIDFIEFATSIIVSKRQLVKSGESPAGDLTNHLFYTVNPEGISLAIETKLPGFGRGNPYISQISLYGASDRLGAINNIIKGTKTRD